MQRRWLACVAVLLPLMILAAIWIVSGVASFGWRKTVRGQEWYAGAIRGHAFFGVNYWHNNHSEPLTFAYKRGLTVDKTALPLTTLGFGYHRGIDFLGRNRLAIVIPLWAPSLVLVALIWLVWRIPRPPRPMFAFPVALAQTESPTSSKPARN